MLGFGLILGWTTVRQEVAGLASMGTANLGRSTLQPFPDIDVSAATPVQARLVELARAEYAKRPRSYDETVMVYTAGVREPWCADFISWIMREAGAPLVNPHSGGWRIPGVLTLREYYQDQNRYQPAGEYRPQLGDVAIFVGKNTADPFSGQHTSLVLAVDGDTMTTIGGNERGRLRVSTQSIKAGEKGLVGFGR